MKSLSKFLFVTACSLAGSGAAEAAVELPQFFTDSMVVQQNAVLTIPGKAKKGATVKITPSWSGETTKVKADKRGKFSAKVQTPAAGGPYTIIIDDGTKGKRTLNDILVGDVWLCSGQSNMEMPVQGWGKVMDFQREVATANNPDLRLLQIKKQTSFGKQDDTDVNMGGWRSAQPETVADFSSIGYFYGNEINDKASIPIGIIDCTWGGTPIEAWSAYEMLSDQGEFATELASISENNFDSSALQQIYEQKYAEWVASTMQDEAEFDLGALQPGWDSINVPGEWEKSVLPDFDGIVLMQREFDVPASLAGKQATLSLGPIDDDDVTYINGVKVGELAGYSIPRFYTIPANLLKEGKNVISVRIADYTGGGGFWGNPTEMNITADDTSIPLAGTWQYKVAKDLAQLPPRPVSPVSSNYPTVLYNAMLYPLHVMPVKGFLWYQGCANVGRDAQYSKLFKAMINDWRQLWENEDAPFYFAQLANYLQPSRFQPNSAWAALRQAQKDALELPNTAMVVCIDLGNPDDIHPKNKQEVARRFALAALNNQYGIPQTYAAPAITDVKIDGRNVRITFDAEINQYGGGHGYVVKGADGTWAQGYGRIIAPTVLEVSSDEIATPVEVRYDWADCPDGNLRGATGLPVSPFTTAKP